MKEIYIPYRNTFVEKYLKSLSNLLGEDKSTVEEWKDLLIPFNRNRLRKEIKETFKRVLGHDVELYEIRKFWATYMSLKGIPGQVIDILQGRTPPKEFEVLMRHYVAIGSQHFILELRKLFDEKTPSLAHC